MAAVLDLEPHIDLGGETAIDLWPVVRSANGDGRVELESGLVDAVAEAIDGAVHLGMLVHLAAVAALDRSGHRVGATLMDR